MKARVKRSILSPGDRGLSKIADQYRPKERERFEVGPIADLAPPPPIRDWFTFVNVEDEADKYRKASLYEFKGEGARRWNNRERKRRQYRGLKAG